MLPYYSFAWNDTSLIQSLFCKFTKSVLRSTFKFKGLPPSLAVTAMFNHQKVPGGKITLLNGSFGFILTVDPWYQMGRQFWGLLRAPRSKSVINFTIFKMISVLHFIHDIITHQLTFQSVGSSTSSSMTSWVSDCLRHLYSLATIIRGLHNSRLSLRWSIWTNLADTIRGQLACIALG